MRFRKGDRVHGVDFPGRYGTVIEDQIGKSPDEFVRVHWDFGLKSIRHSKDLAYYRPPIGTRVEGTEMEDEGTIIAHVGKRKVEIEWDEKTGLDREVIRYPFAETEHLKIVEDHEHIHFAITPKNPDLNLDVEEKLAELVAPTPLGEYHIGFGEGYRAGLSDGKKSGYAKGRSDIEHRDLAKIKHQAYELASLNRIVRELYADNQGSAW